MRSGPFPTATFATMLLRAMGLAAVIPLSACGGNVVVDGLGNGSDGSGANDGSGGGDGGSGAGGAGGQGGATTTITNPPCVPQVGSGEQLQHVCLDACPQAGQEQAALSPIVEWESCDDWCCSSKYITSVQCGPSLEGGACCFDVTTKISEEICMGRPFVAGGHARIAQPLARRDWSEPSAAGACGAAAPDPNTASALSAAWRRDALYEHASVASFARFTLELLAVGAPSDLVVAAQQAMEDEIAHARACFALAAAYGGVAVGPSPLDVTGWDLRTTLADVAEAAAEEGCVGETLSALAARAALEGAADPAVRAALSRIVAEEEAHAALAWRFVAWALSQRDPETTARVTRVLTQMRGVPSVDPNEGAGADPAAWRAHGRLTAAEQVAVFRRGLAEVVAPCAAALLASVASDTREERQSLH